MPLSDLWNLWVRVGDEKIWESQSEKLLCNLMNSCYHIQDGALQSGIEGCGMHGFGFFRLHLLPPYHLCSHILDV